MGFFAVKTLVELARQANIKAFCKICKVLFLWHFAVEQKKEKCIMTNELQIFENADFGKVRTMVKDGEPYFVGKDVAEILGYKDTVNALKAHVDEEDKMGWQITTPSRGT